MAEKPITVWMVSALTGPNGVKGELEVEDGAVTFRPAMQRGAVETFGRDQIKRARRVWGSPVLELVLRIPDGLPVVGFYFVKPPSLEAPQGTRFQFKSRARRKAASQLYKGNAQKKAEIESVLMRIRSSPAQA